MSAKAWLFGSFARGGDDYKSDIDVMIEVPGDSNFSLFDISVIQYQLEKLVPMKVDVVMKDGLTPNFLERIIPDLKIIYERYWHYRESKAGAYPESHCRHRDYYKRCFKRDLFE